MSIDFNNLQGVSDNQLMKVWHERMATLYELLEIFDNGPKEQRKAYSPQVTRLQSEMELLKAEIIRRECNPIDPDQMDAILKLDLN